MLLLQTFPSLAITENVSCHDANFSVSDDIWCHKWRKSRHHDGPMFLINAAFNWNLRQYRHNSCLVCIKVVCRHWKNSYIYLQILTSLSSKIDCWKQWFHIQLNWLIQFMRWKYPLQKRDILYHADILVNDIEVEMHFFEIMGMLIKIHWVSIYGHCVLVRVVALCRTGGKSYPETVMAHFTVRP